MERTALALVVALVSCAGCGGSIPDPCDGLGERGCVPGENASFICDGTRLRETPCKDQQQCVSGTCKPIVCTPSLFFCDGQTADVCDSTGTVETRTDCAMMNQTCIIQPLTASCATQICDPGTLFCSADGTSVQKCGLDGRSSDTVQECTDPQQRGNACVGGVACRDRCTIVEAQDRSTLGCKFLAAPLFDAAPAIVVGNPQPDLPATVTVQWGTHAPIVQTIAAASNATIALSGGGNTHAMSTTGVAPAIQISSTVPVYAWIADDRDGAALHPEHALSTRYLVGVDTAGPQVVAVTASVSGTVVTVTPTASTDAGGAIPSDAAGAPLAQTLQRGDVLILSSASALTGSTVTATGPIAVSAASSAGEASMPGADTLGKTFSLPWPSLIVARDAATVTTAQGPVSLAAGASTMLPAQSITSNAPLLALELSTASDAIPPAEQWRAAAFLPPSTKLDLFAQNACTITDGAQPFPLAAGTLTDASTLDVGPVTATAPFFGLAVTTSGGAVPTAFGLASINP